MPGFIKPMNFQQSEQNHPGAGKLPGVLCVTECCAPRYLKDSTFKRERFAVTLTFHTLKNKPCACPQHMNNLWRCNFLTAKGSHSQQMTQLLPPM